MSISFTQVELTPKKGISRTLVFSIWAVLVCVIISLTLWLLENNREKTFTQIQGQAKQASAFFNRHISDTTRYADDYIKTVRKIFLQSQNLEDVRRYMHDIPPNTEILSHITIMDKQAVPILISSGLEETDLKPGAHALDRDYFRFQHKHFLEDTPYISKAKKGRSTGLVTVRLVRPIVTPDNKFLGILFAAIHEKQITQFLNITQIGENSTTTLLGTDKIIRFHKSKEGFSGIGQDLSKSKVWQALEQSPSGSFAQTSLVDGTEHYWHYNAIKNFGLITMLSVATQDIEKENILYRNSTIALATLSILILSILSFLVVREVNIAALNSEIGNHVRLEEQLRHEIMLSQKANETHTAFMSQMSHELRTPLNAILGFSQLLGSYDKNKLNETQQNYVRHIQQSGEYLLSLIEKVLDLSQIESGKLQIEMDNGDVAQCIEECLHMVESRRKEKNITIDSFHKSVQPLIAHMDATRVKQVLLNLLSNAVKYNRENGSISVIPKITTDGYIRISISDTGSGIKPSLQEKLFEPFERLGLENSHIEGAGIGLTISRHLIQEMGGRIGFESKVNKGSTFWIDLKQSI
ncbi:MAG: hypothetical protein HWE30_02765 [Methylocystaceae bacterium]|nr:hypothetical protein [Methylocystaceae bacterium]